MQIGARLWGKVLVSHRNRAIKAIQCPFFVTLAPLSLEAEKQASKCYLIQSCLFPTIKLLIQILSSNSMLTTFTLHLFFIRFISPCRSLCESVRDSCAPIMSCYGYPWPEILRCDQYPADHLMCISSITNSTVHTGGRRGKKLTNYTHMLELTQFIKKMTQLMVSLFQYLRQAVGIVSWRRRPLQKTHWRPFVGVILVSINSLPPLFSCSYLSLI